MGEKPNPFAALVEVEAILALGSLIVFAIALWAVLFNIVPADNEKYIMLMLGALIGVVKDTFGRYFQATKGSQEQRREYADLATTAAAAVATAAAPAEPVPVVVTNDAGQAVPVTDQEQPS